MYNNMNLNYYRGSMRQSSITEGDLNARTEPCFYRYSLQNRTNINSNQNRFNCSYNRKSSIQMSNKKEPRTFFRLNKQNNNDKKYQISHKVDKSADSKHNNSSKKNSNERVLEQLSQLIENKKKNLNNTITFTKRNIAPRNPFKFSQITSIKNKTFEVKEESQSKKNRNPFTSEVITHEYMPVGLSVREFAYHEDKNILNRKEMQDFHKIIDKYMNDSTKGYFSLFDGHGTGTEPIKYARDRLPEILSKFLKDTNYNVEKSLIYSLQKLDDELKLYSEIENCGSTMTLVYIYTDYQSNKRILYCANLGDSKGILITTDQEDNKRYRVLTTDHKCSNEEEAKRIRNVGGIVFNGRLFGQLALSRALGDFSMKAYGLICTPSIHKHIINDKDKYVVIASDGVWDEIKEKEISEMCIDGDISCEALGKKIVDTAIHRGSRDNVSCITIKL